MAEAEIAEVETGKVGTNETGNEEEEVAFRPGRLPRWFTGRKTEGLARASVIDIPMRWGPEMPAQVEEEFPRCSYVGPTDRKCGRRATEKGLCQIHARWELWTEWGWPMTCPEDRESVQEALRQTLSWVMAGHVTEKQALAVVAICRAILRTL